MNFRDTQKITIEFEFQERTDTSLPDRERAMEDIYEAIEKLGYLKNEDTYDLIRDWRDTKFIVKVM